MQIEIHSRSNHPIEFLFNTDQKTKMTIDGGINFEASGKLQVLYLIGKQKIIMVQLDKLDHYEEGNGHHY